MRDLDLLGIELLEVSASDTDIPKAPIFLKLSIFFWRVFMRSKVFDEIFILVERLL